MDRWLVGRKNPSIILIVSVLLVTEQMAIDDKLMAQELTKEENRFVLELVQRERDSIVVKELLCR